jgi:hypothetical protein
VLLTGEQHIETIVVIEMLWYNGTGRRHEQAAMSGPIWDAEFRLEFLKERLQILIAPLNVYYI